jgi:hypothetical protein
MNCSMIRCWLTLHAQRIGAAQRIAPGKVDLALTLVGYDKQVSKAMEYVFGNTLICAGKSLLQHIMRCSHSPSRDRCGNGEKSNF